MRAPTIDGIIRARSGIDPLFTGSPVLDVDARDIGALSLIVESFNPIGSFKGRGASWFVANLPPGTRRVACASAGNFGQGIAHAARRAGVPAVVYASINANPSKLDRIRRLGATVVTVGDDFDAAKAAGLALAAADGDLFVEDGRDPFVTEGAGTIAAELLERRPDLTSIVVPVGNGALVNGIGMWARAHAPHVRIIGVCASMSLRLTPCLRRANLAGVGGTYLADYYLSSGGFFGSVVSVKKRKTQQRQGPRSRFFESA